MGLFRKGQKGQEPTDEALSFLTVAAANEFRREVRQTFAELGLEVAMHPDHAVDDTGRQFGFWNVAAQCVGAEPSEWSSIIREHMQSVVASLEADPFKGADRSDIVGRTFARLYSTDSLPALEPYPHREFVPGVVEMLALDLPDTVAVFDHRRAAEFGGWESLHAAGISNLRALPAEPIETLEAPNGGSFNVLLSDSVYTASRALLLPQVASELNGETPSEFGWLMSVPNRQQLAWHFIRDSTVVGVASAMAHFTLLGHGDAPGPVSPHLYWWNGSGYEQLTEVDDDGTLSIHASPEFTDVLNSLVTDD